MDWKGGYILRIFGKSKLGEGTILLPMSFKKGEYTKDVVIPIFSHIIGECIKRNVPRLIIRLDSHLSETINMAKKLGFSHIYTMNGMILKRFS